MDSPLQMDTAKASMERPTAMTNNSQRSIFISSYTWVGAQKKTYLSLGQISLIVSDPARRGIFSSMLTGPRSAPTTPLKSDQFTTIRPPLSTLSRQKRKYAGKIAAFLPGQPGQCIMKKV